MRTILDAPFANDRAVGDATAPTDLTAPPGARAIAFENHCPTTIWVGALGNPVTPAKRCASDGDCDPPQTACNVAAGLCTWAAPGGGGWALPPGDRRPLFLPESWAGRFWPRTGCRGFNDAGTPACATGDCGGRLQCAVGVGGSPPATLAEIAFIPRERGTDFYDVSNVDGANVPTAMAPVAGTFDPMPPSGEGTPYYCGSPGCTGSCGALAPCPWNLEAACPPELRDEVQGMYVGCRSANQACVLDPQSAALGCAQARDLYACSGGGPNAVSGSCYSQGAAATCCGCPRWSPAGACRAHDPAWELPSRPERYAQVFKDACPTAYSFPYDDLTSTFTCRGTTSRAAAYVVTFCP